MDKFNKKTIELLEDREFPNCSKCIYSYLPNKQPDENNNLVCRLEPPKLKPEGKSVNRFEQGQIIQSVYRDYIKKYLDVSKNDVCGQGKWICDKVMMTYSGVINWLYIKEIEDRIEK